MTQPFSPSAPSFKKRAQTRFFRRQLAMTGDRISRPLYRRRSSGAVSTADHKDSSAPSMGNKAVRLQIWTRIVNAMPP